MTTTDPIPFDSAAARERLLARVDAFRQQLRWHLAVAGMVRIVLATLVLVLLSFLLDRTFRLGFGVRMTLLPIGVTALAYEVWRSLVIPLSQQLTPVEVADVLDSTAGRGPDLAPRVATLLQADLPDALSSHAMTRAATAQADAALDRVDLLDRLDVRRLARRELRIAAVVLAFAALAGSMPDSSRIWLKRWLGGSNEPWPQRTYLAVAGLTDDGRLLVPRGEAATVLVRVKGGSVEPQQVTLVRRPPAGPRVDAVMNRFAAGDFRQDLPPVNATETIEIAGGDEELDPIYVEPIDRPRIDKLELISQHPTEPTPTTHAFGGEDADLTFLPHTALRLRLRASTPVARVTLGEPGLSATKLSDKEFEIAWTHLRPVHLSIELTAAGTGLTSVATPLTIGLLVDQPPRVTLAFTGVRQRVTPQATIPLTIEARDDYGLHDLGLVARTDWLDANQKRQTGATTQPLFGPQHPAVEKDVQLSNAFAIADLHAPVGTVVAITATATDERYEGPQTGKSKEATFRLVAPEELFKEILLRQQGERAKFRKATDAAIALRPALAAMTAADAAALARQHRTLQREVERIGTSLAESLTEMRLNALGTAESYALMERNVTAPLKALAEQAMTEQRDALDAMAAGNPVDAPASAERQDRIVDAMNLILKQMAQWDSFVDVLNQLNEIIRMQEKAKQTTDQLKKKETDSVFDQ